MAYNEDKTWDDLVRSLGQKSRNLMQAIRDAKAEYDEWQSFRAGRTNADIATALSKAESDVAEMDAAYSSFLHIENYLTNNSPVSGTDHAFSLRKFS